MNNPTIDSTPASSGGRPATVAPNTTSLRPASRASNSAHAPCSTVFTVSPQLRASPVTAAVSSAETSTRMLPSVTGARAGSAGATRVGSSRPASSACHAAPAAFLSCRASQARYSRYEATGGSTPGSPPAA
jgi:hypothetical protein